MRLKFFVSAAIVLSSVGLWMPDAKGQITVATALIGNPGNCASSTTSQGAVAYEFQIGATEVTNTQYAAFLNAVARSDPNNLYDVQMASVHGGITRSGASGLFSYAVNIGRGNYPVVFVSFWDAARFANWLHNGQPIGPQIAAQPKGVPIR